MDSTMIRRLVEKARDDSDFFHALVFSPESVIESVEELDERTRRAFTSGGPESRFASMIGETVERLPPNEELLEPDSARILGHALEAAVLRRLGQQMGCGGDVTCSCTSGTCGGTCGGSTCSATCTGDSCGTTCGDSCGYTTNLQMLGRDVMDEIEGLDFGWR